jgi:hypothetical protein
MLAKDHSGIAIELGNLFKEMKRLQRSSSQFNPPRTNGTNHPYQSRRGFLL